MCNRFPSSEMETLLEGWFLMIGADPYMKDETISQSLTLIRDTLEAPLSREVRR